MKDWIQIKFCFVPVCKYFWKSSVKKTMTHVTKLYPRSLYMQNLHINAISCKKRLGKMLICFWWQRNKSRLLIFSQELHPTSRRIHCDFYLSLLMLISVLFFRVHTTTLLQFLRFKERLKSEINSLIALQFNFYKIRLILLPVQIASYYEIQSFAVYSLCMEACIWIKIAIFPYVFFALMVSFVQIIHSLFPFKTSETIYGLQ